MDKKTRSIIEAVIFDLCKQGAKNAPFDLEKIGTISDDTLLNFIYSYYD